MGTELLDAIVLTKQRGRPAAPASERGLFYVRDLDEADLPELQLPSPRGADINPARMRTTHHLLAMVLANGATRARAAQLTGYAPGTVTALQGSPAFTELVEHYKQQTAATFREISERAAALGLSFMDEIQARFEEDPDSFSNEDLLENMKALLDRTVLPSKGPRPTGGGAERPAGLRIEFVEPEGRQAQVTVIEGEARRVEDQE